MPFNNRQAHKNVFLCVKEANSVENQQNRFLYGKDELPQINSGGLILPAGADLHPMNWGQGRIVADQFRRLHAPHPEADLHPIYSKQR